MTDLNTLLSKCLPKLFGSFDTNNHINNAIGIIDVVHQACVKYPIKEQYKGSLCLHIFDEKYGIVKLLKTIVNVTTPEVKSLKNKSFKFLDDFLDLVESSAVPYGTIIMDLCVTYVKRESAATVKRSATVTLSKILEICHGMVETANLDIKQLIQDLFLQLSIRKVTSTVKEEILCLLGVISHFYPENFIPYSERILNVYIQELKKEIDLKATDHNLNIITGCLLGLKEYLYNFTVSYTEDKDKSFQIYQIAKCAVEAKTEKKYNMRKAGLQLLAAHASQFAIYLYDDALKLYEIITNIMSQSNRELQKISLVAVDALLKQVVEILPNRIEDNRSNAIQVFNYFMKDFKAKLMGDGSSKQLIIAVKGYGLFAGACKHLSGDNEVKRMFLNIIQRSEHLFFGHSSDTENMTQLPSFIESLASIIKEVDNVPEMMLSPLEKLIIFQIEKFPHVPSPYRFLVTQAIIKVFLAIQTREDVFPGVLSRIVYQGVIRTCSHSLISDVESQTAEKETNIEDFVVENPRIKIITYQDYLYLWSRILNIVQWKELTAMGIPLTIRQNLKEAVYDEIIKTTMLLFHKLNLTIGKERQDVLDETTDEGFSSDPLHGLYPNNLNDCRIFLNLVDFARDFLGDNSNELFEKWVYTFGKETVYFSTKYPFNSGFYKLIALNLSICSKINYFENNMFNVLNATQGLNDSCVKEQACSFYLFSKFAKEVVVRSQQFKDDLLASCLLVLLALPTQIVKNEINDLIPALQSTFKLGLSYLPLAEIGLHTLERWCKEVPPNVMKKIYPDVLPLLNHYLLSSGVEGYKVTENVSKRKHQKGHKMSTKYVKLPVKAVSADVIEESKLTKLQYRIMTFLGSIGSENNRGLLEYASKNVEIAAIAWDLSNRNHLKYPVPFVDMKPEIYFDDFLPRVLELATSSSDRQVKVAACEVLHSFVLYIVGRGSQLPESSQEKTSMENLYKHIFPGLLKLSCDVDQVTKQLFHPLVLQMTHWFTHRRTIHTSESQVILLALWDGATDPQNAAMRDFSALCLKEYFTWALKQSKEQNGGEKIFFQKMSSFALHPNPYTRLGASLVFNNIYTIFRNEEKLVQKYTLELLIIFVDSLALAHNDDKLLGTQKLCSDALDHIERICRIKAHLFKEQNQSCRKPRCLKEADLQSAVEWLFHQCGNSQTECRHKCMELVSKLSPFVSGLNITGFIQIFKLNNGNICQRIFEKRLTQIGVPPLKTSLAPWHTVVTWLEALMASLECYNWVLMESANEPCEEWLCNAAIFQAVDFFLLNIVLQNIDIVIGHFSNKLDFCFNCSPKEMLEYNRIKCSVLMRIYTLFETVYRKSSTAFSEKFIQYFQADKLSEIIVLTVINPSLIGFDLTDHEVLMQLYVEMLKVLKTSKCQEKSFKTFCCQYLSRNMKYNIFHVVPCDLTLADLDHVFHSQILTGYDLLIKAGLWPDTVPSPIDKANFLETVIQTVCHGVSPKEGSILQKSVLSLSALNLVKQLLIISSNLGMEPEMLVNMLLDSTPLASSDSGKITKRGLLVFSMFENEICEIICKLHCRFIPLLVSHITIGQFDAVSILVKFLNVISSIKSYRKEYGSAVIKSLLNCWGTLQTIWEERSNQNMLDSILSIFIKMIMIDSEIANNSTGKYPLSLFWTYTELLKKREASLDFKLQLLDLLPFFLSEDSKEVGNLKSSLECVIVAHFPINSKELVVGSSQYNNYLSATQKLFSALKFTGNEMLLELLTLLFCREEKHIMEDKFQDCLSSTIKSVPPYKHQQLAEVPWKLIKDGQFAHAIHLNILDYACLTILRNSALSAFVQFYVSNITYIMNILKQKLYSSSGESELAARINSFKLMEILYNRLTKDQLHTVESQIVSAYVGGTPTKGNELTSEIIKLALEFKRENLPSKTFLSDLYRKLYCSSLNTLIAVISCTQNELKFYNTFIFKENPSKDEKIWENIIDSTKAYIFNIELDEPLVRQKKFVSIRRHCREPESDDWEDVGKQGQSSLHFMASENLALSSLADDVSKFDFSTTEQMLSSKKENANSFKMPSHASEDSKVEYIEMEVDELNQHECMAPLSWLLRHMANQELIPNVQQTVAPLWLEAIITKLEDVSAYSNVKLFLVRLIVNNSKVLFSYATVLIRPLMGLIVSGTLGLDLNYNVLDVIITMLSWAPEVIPQDSFIHRHEASNVLEFVIKKCAHPRKDIFRNNLEVVKTLLECWKERIEIPYRQVYEMMKFSDLTSKVNLTGIQLLGVILTCNFPPYSECGIDNEIFLNYLVSNLNNKYQEIFAATSEVIGLVLKYRAQKVPNISEDVFFNTIVQHLAKLNGDQSGKFLTSLFKIHNHCPEIVPRFFPKLLLMHQKLQGVFLNYALQMLCSSVTIVQNGFYELKSIGLFENIEHKEEDGQHIILQSIESVAVELTCDEILNLLPFLITIHSQPAIKCRLVLFKILMAFYDKYRFSNGAKEKEILRLSQETLLKALADSNLSLRLMVNNFWSSENRLPVTTKERLIALMKNIYSPPTENSFLQSATFLLLERTSHSPDYKRNVFDHPLSECNFLDYNISTSWRQRYAPMTPLFVDSMSNSLNLSVPSLNASSHAGNQPLIKVTQQQHGDFPATHDASFRGNTFNWLTEKSIDTFQNFGSAAGSSSNTDSSTKSYLLTAKKRTPSADRHFIKESAVNQSMKEKLEKSNVWHLKRRFLKDKQNVSNVFANIEIRRQDTKQALHKEQQKRRESEVTMYRRYRIGELPDIEIPNSAIIAPLQALAQNDAGIAKMLLKSILVSICDYLKNEPDMYEPFVSEVCQCLYTILKKTIEYVPSVISFCLESLYQIGCTSVDPEIVFCASLNSNQQSIGILLLESKILNFHAPEPKVKRLKSTRKPIEESTSQWIRLSGLHKSLMDYDVVNGIFTLIMGNRDLNKKALEFESSRQYSEAVKLYSQLFQNVIDATDENITQAEEDFWDKSVLHCYDMLTSWEVLEQDVLSRFTDPHQPDLQLVWEEAYYRDNYLPFVVRSKMKRLLEGEDDQSLLSFFDKAQENEDRQSYIQEHFAEELALLYIIQDNFDVASHYSFSCFQKFLKDWRELSPLDVATQESKLQDLQKFVELKEFLEIMVKSKLDSVDNLLQTWSVRNPSVIDSLNIWNDTSSNRLLYLKKFQDKYNIETSQQSTLNDSQSMEIKSKDTSISFLKYRTAFQLSYTSYCVNQGNIPVALKYLKKIRKDAKELGSHHELKFIETYCRTIHKKSLKLTGEEKLKILLSSCSNLDKFTVINMMTTSQKLLQHEAFELLAGVFINEEVRVQTMNPDYRTKILEITGCETEREIISTLHVKNFSILKSAVESVEEKISIDVNEPELKSEARSAYMALANFCNQKLRQQEISTTGIYQSYKHDEYPKILIKTLLAALRYGDTEALQLFPRLLQIIASYPEVLPQFVKHAGCVPCWMFIGWINQIVALLDKPEAIGVHDIIISIADQYPNAAIYPFLLSCESYSFPDTCLGGKCKSFVERTKATLERDYVITDFLEALQHLSVPHIIFKDYILRLEVLLTESAKENEILELYNEMLTNVFALKDEGKSRRIPVGPDQEKFAGNYLSDIKKICGKDGEKLLSSSRCASEISKDLKAIMKKSKENINSRSGCGSLLKEFSPWLSDFQPWKFDTQIEIPGQYTGKGKPLPEYHVKIAGFDEKVLILSSITVPRRITIRGNDEKEYKILVKSGEDLRQDSRLQQLFDIMNEIYAKDPECARRHLKLITYKVVPLSSRFGLIEWVDGTIVLNDFIHGSLTVKEKKEVRGNSNCQEKLMNWVGKHFEDMFLFYMTMYKEKSRLQSVKNFEELVELTPKGLLKRAFMKLSSSPEAFYHLRSEFARSHAVICISQWLLGVGDRHLGNFLVDLTSGREIGIDFGHAFGSATQFLVIPELVPFRLTNQYLQLMEPLHEKGTLKATMIHVLSALRKNTSLLLNVMDIFIKEPTVDWKAHAKRQQRELEITGEDIKDDSNWFPKQRVQIALAKLNGSNPCFSMQEELKFGHATKSVFEKMKAVCLGDPEFNIRAQLAESGLSVEEQVSCLIDQATDYHVLCKTYLGWSPWM